MLSGVTCPRCSHGVKCIDANVYECQFCGRFWEIRALTSQEQIHAALAPPPRPR